MAVRAGRGVGRLRGPTARENRANIWSGVSVRAQAAAISTASGIPSRWRHSSATARKLRSFKGEIGPDRPRPVQVQRDAFDIAELLRRGFTANGNRQRGERKFALAA